MKWIILAGLLVSGWASAGNDAGGGGNALVCRNSAGVIISAETLDLFEARVMQGWEVPISSEPAAEQSLKFVSQLGTLNKNIPLFTMLQQITGITRILPPEYKLEPIDDAFPFIGKKGCAIEQLARYLSTNELLIDGEIWAALDETNKAALYIHEALYRDLRLRGATNSRRARRIVGYLMADMPYRSPVFPSEGEKIELVCTSNSTYPWVAKFFVTLETDAEGFKNALTHFLILDNRDLVSRTYDILNDRADLFTNPKVGDSTVIDTTSEFERSTRVALTVKKKNKDGSILFKFDYERQISAEDERPGPDLTVDMICQKPFGPQNAF